jgi:SAM-dependent methyltransferase
MTGEYSENQIKQIEWFEQWQLLRDDEIFLFRDWIYPNTIEDFKGKDVLECGCGGGQHTSFVAPYAKTITSVDLNTTTLAADRNKHFKNVIFVEDDIAKMKLNKQFDIVFSIGVINHTDDPDATIQNLIKHVKPGGRLILWVYSKEGNFLVRSLVEPFRRLFLRNLNKKTLINISKIITFFLYVPVYSIYLLPIKFMPYYHYFQNFRILSFYRNMLNVFDKLNAPQVEFIDYLRIKSWFNQKDFDNVYISSYKGVSWRGSGTKIY